MKPIANDGRSARAVRTRSVLIGTCKFLMCDGTFRPSMVAVAALANRATRSAFQHFPTVDHLHAEALADETVRRAVLLHAANSDTSCLDWPAELQDAVIHALVFGRPIERENTNNPSQNNGAEHGQEKASDQP